LAAGHATTSRLQLGLGVRFARELAPALRISHRPSAQQHARNRPSRGATANVARAWWWVVAFFRKKLPPAHASIQDVKQHSSRNNSCGTRHPTRCAQPLTTVNKRACPNTVRHGGCCWHASSTLAVESLRKTGYGGQITAAPFDPRRLSASGSGYVGTNERPPRTTVILDACGLLI